MSRVSQTILIIGSGVVEEATGKGLLKHGHNVMFYDIDPKRVKYLRRVGYKAIGTKEVEKVRKRGYGIAYCRLRRCASLQRIYPTW